MNLHFIRSAEKKRILKELKEQFGISNLPYLLIESGKEKIRAFSGHLSKEEIIQIAEIANVEIIGLYLLKREDDFRLSLDATTMLKNQIVNHIIEIDNVQFHDWIRGNDLEIEKPRGTYIIKHKSDFLGCGKSNRERVFNYVPKDRRIRK